MTDPIYAGIEIKPDTNDAILLHAANNLYKAANNMILIISKIPEDVRRNIFTELKIPGNYTLNTISEQKDMSYNTLHYTLINSISSGLDDIQNDYLEAFEIFFIHIYPVIYMNASPSEERDKVVEKAYDLLKKCSKKPAKIFNEKLLGKNASNEKMIAMLTKQMDDLVAAQKMADNLKKEMATKPNDSNNDNSGS